MRRGCDVHIVCTRRSNDGDRTITFQDESFDSIPVRRIISNPSSRPQRFGQRLYDPVIGEQIGAALRQWRADIFHITNPAYISAASITAAKSLGMPVVWTATDFGLTCARFTLLKWDGSLCDGKATFGACFDCLRPRTGLSTPLFNALSLLPERAVYPVALLGERLPLKRHGVFAAAVATKERLSRLEPLLRDIDLTFAPSTWMKQVLVMNGVDPRRVIVSIYGLETGGCSHPPRTSHTPLRFAFVGRIHAMKGVDVLVDAFNRLHTEDGASLAIYGSPTPDQFEYAGRIWAMAKGNRAISFGRELGREDLAGVLDEIDVLVVPSIWHENSPIAVLEAQDRGIPVIASDVAGVADQIQDGVNGLLFRRGDASHLAAQMQRLVDAPVMVSELSSRIPPLKSIVEETEMLLGHYRSLTSARQTI
jgi:glycosyltransferase involved in cell wall biosynthesis